MEVFLMAPVAVLMGALLIYLSSSSGQTPQPAAVGVKAPSMKRQPPSPPSKPQPVKAMASRTARGVTQADVLLADILSELLEMREEAAATHSKVEKLTAELQELKEAVHSMKRPSRKAS